MSTITKELAKLFRKITNSEIDAEGNANVVLSPADSLLINNARIALASLEAEPVAYIFKHPAGRLFWSLTDESNKGQSDVMPVYTAPPASVALPSGYSDFEEIWSSSTHPLTQDDEMKDFAWDIWNACRAAMLKHSEPFMVTSDHCMMEMPQVEAINAVTAMLQGSDGTLTNEGTIPVTQFKPVADLYGLTSPTGGETSFTFDAVEARDFIDGGWSCQEYVELERFQEAITNHTEDKLAMVDHSGDSNNMVEPITTACKLPEETGSSLQLRNLIRQRHAEWSQATFGDVGPVGPLKHLSKEALEAAEEPDDLSEWADMQFLLWDAQRRAGISDGEITAAMEEKLKVNMERQWPEPKDGEPRQHIQNDWQRCNHLLPIGELLKRLNEQTGEEWVRSRDLDYGKWVKCSDRMPVKMVNVLVFDAGGNKFICCQENGFWRDFRVGSSRHEITHWMALPEIPLEIK